MKSEVTNRRAGKPHTSMFLRMLMRAAVLRRGRAASALLAMVVAAAVATAMLNLYEDVQAKLRKEFRNYGANVVMVAKGDQALPADAIDKINAILAGHGLAVPFAYVVARTSNGQSIVVSGTNFEQVRKLDSWWSVTSWPANPQDALVGVRAAALVGPQGTPFDLSFQGRIMHINPAGILRTGADEDSRIYLSSQDFESWTGVKPSTIEIASSGSSEEVSSLIRQLSQAVPVVEVHPIRQIMEGEAHVLGKTRATLAAATGLIIATAALCVLSALIGWVVRSPPRLRHYESSGRVGGLRSADSSPLKPRRWERWERSSDLASA